MLMPRLLPALFPELRSPEVIVLMLRPLPALFPVLRSPWSSSIDAETSTHLVPCTTGPLEFQCWCWDLYPPCSLYWGAPGVPVLMLRSLPPCSPGPASPGATLLQKKHISHKSLIPATTSQQQFLENPTLNSLALKKKFTCKILPYSLVCFCPHMF